MPSHSGFKNMYGTNTTPQYVVGDILRRSVFDCRFRYKPMQSAYPEKNLGNERAHNCRKFLRQVTLRSRDFDMFSLIYIISGLRVVIHQIYKILKSFTDRTFTLLKCIPEESRRVLDLACNWWLRVGLLAPRPPLAAIILNTISSKISCGSPFRKWPNEKLCFSSNQYILSFSHTWEFIHAFTSNVL